MSAPVLWVLVVASLHTLAQSSILDDVAGKALQNIHDNMGDNADLLRTLFSPDTSQGLKPNSREKRLIELPRGLVFQLKWWLDFPVQPFVRFHTAWELEALIGAEYPSEFIHDIHEPTLAEILPPDLVDIVHDKFTDGREGEELYEEESEEHHGRKKRSGGRKGREEGKSLSRKKRAAQTEREMMYRVVEHLLKKTGLPPRACLLRTICEVAEAPFEQEMLGDFINTIFRPSRGAESNSGDDYDEFLLAEHHGHHNGSCHLQYGQCPETVFDRIPFFSHQLSY